MGGQPIAAPVLALGQTDSAFFLSGRCKRRLTFYRTDMDRRTDKSREDIVQQAQLLQRAGDAAAAERYLRACGFSAPAIMRIMANRGSAFHATRVPTNTMPPR